MISECFKRITFIVHFIPNLLPGTDVTEVLIIGLEVGDSYSEHNPPH